MSAEAKIEKYIRIQINFFREAIVVMTEVELGEQESLALPELLVLRFKVQTVISIILKFRLLSGLFGCNF